MGERQLSDKDKSLIERMYQMELVGFQNGYIAKAQFDRLCKLGLIEGTMLRPKLTPKGHDLASSPG